MIIAALVDLGVPPTVIAEAAGAASVAAAMAALAGTGDIVCIVSGGNIDAPKLGAILNGQDPF